MAQFEITYPNGVREIVNQSDCSTVKQFINTRFGTNRQGGAKVKLMSDTESTPKPAKPAKK